MSKTVLIPLPSDSFDPTECAIPWRILKLRGIKTQFATPDGLPAHCDRRMLDGQGLGILAPLLIADKNAQAVYHDLKLSPEFQNPISWGEIDSSKYDGIILPGGHAPRMKEYLESEVLQKHVADFFTANKPVGAICHGVVLAARSKTQGESVLKHRQTTALLKSQELMAWGLTCLWLGNYYRTYPQTVEDEVLSCLQSKNQFHQGPMPLFRDSIDQPERGFVVKDGNYISARWPGDAHKFALEFLELLR